MTALVRPADVVDAQADLLARMSDDQGRFNQGLAGVLLSQRSGTVPEHIGHVVPPAKLYHGHTREEALQALDESHVARHAVKTAYPYHVSEDMTQLVMFAASQLERTDRFDRTLAPTGAGLAYFAGGLPTYDVRGAKQTIHWLLWHPALGQDQHGQKDPCVALWMWNDWAEPDDISNQILDQGVLDEEGARAFGRWSFIGREVCFDDQRMGPPTVGVRESERLRYLEAGYPLDPEAAATNVLRLVHAFWLMLNQTVTKTAAERLTGPAAKRARRASLQPEVTVVKLRRVAYPEREGEPGSRNWTKRWIVRGHWRWQAYGPGRTLRRRIWVHPFIKGPEDAPLAADTRVYGLHR